MRALVERQMRVVLETSNFLTGQKVLSLRYVPGAASEAITTEAVTSDVATTDVATTGQEVALVLPSVAMGLDELSASASEIANALSHIPFGEIGENLNRTLASVERVVGSPEVGGVIVSLDATFKDLHDLVQRAQAGLTPALARLPGISERLEHAVQL